MIYGITYLRVHFIVIQLIGPTFKKKMTVSYKFGDINKFGRTLFLLLATIYRAAS